MLQRLTNLSIFLIGLLVLSVCVPGVIADTNTAPTTNGTIPGTTAGVVLEMGTSLTIDDIHKYFSDADGDELSYNRYLIGYN